MGIIPLHAVREELDIERVSADEERTDRLFRILLNVPRIRVGSALANAGNYPIVVKNPMPVVNQFWGDTSNAAHMLVPFSFSSGWVVGQN